MNPHFATTTEFLTRRMADQGVSAPAIMPLSASGISYRTRGHDLLKDVSFTLNQGPCTIVLGPNGSGKTMLLRVCHGLIAPTSGSIVWAGLSPHATRLWRSMVFQKPIVLRRSTAANIRYALSNHGLSYGERRDMTDHVLELTHLTHLAKRPARVLSGGEQQRLAIARAWVTHPQVILLDEPTSKLDPQATLVIENLIQAIGATGTKIIMSTHDLGQAHRLGDEVLFLNNGELVEYSQTQQFFAAPRSAAGAAFIEGKLFY